MKIKVTKMNIADAIRFRRLKKLLAWHCPVALAVKLAIHGKEGEVAATGHLIRVGKNLLPAPSKVQKFIKRFDNKKPVKPFTFDLPIEQPQEDKR
jgi:hypothetical protein